MPVTSATPVLATSSDLGNFPKPDPSDLAINPQPTEPPALSIPYTSLICGNLDTGVDYTVHRVPLRADGIPDYSELWPLKLDCDNGMGDVEVSEAVPVITPVQKAAATAAVRASAGAPAEALYSVYKGCGANDPNETITSRPPTTARDRFSSSSRG